LSAAKDYLQNNWTELKSKLRKRWGKITEDDLTQINGNNDELIRTLRKRYGYGKAQAEIEINQWLIGQKDN
jgi:uncharacterized protein YjbJ (UPF0337 family)